jgi:glutathione S-transferase
LLLGPIYITCTLEMVKPTLYLSTMTNAPNPRRVVMYLSERGLDVDSLLQVELLDMRKLEHKDAKYKIPNSKLPAMAFPDGSCICESMAICRAIDAIASSGSGSMFGRTPKEIGEIEMWIRMIDIEYMLSAIGKTLEGTSNEGITNEAHSFVNRE